MRKLDGEAVLMRIFLGEGERIQGRPAYRFLVDLLRQEKIAGATVLRGVLGFGAKSHLHTASLLRLSQHLPVVVEIIDTQQNIDRVLPLLDEFLTEGLVTCEKVRVLRYAPGNADTSSNA